MNKMKKIEHRIKASPTQLKKLMTGGAVTLKPDNFDPSSRHMIVVSPNASRRIGTAMRKNKGVRIALKPDEDLMEDDEIEGGKISLKGINKGLKSVGKALTSKKAKKIYREVGKEVLPIAKGIADAGIKEGSKALAAYMGNPALAPVIEGSAKAGLNVGYKKLGKEVGLDPKTPTQTIDTPEKLQKAVLSKAEENIKKRTKGAEKKVAEKAMAGEYKDVKELATDYAIEKFNEATQSATNQDEIDALLMGRGVRITRSKGATRIGGRVRTLPVREPIVGMGVTGMKTAGYDMRRVEPSVAPSPITQLGSPYERINSPSMSPFIAASPQLANKPITSVATLSGGSFLSAGSRRGFGFNPAG